MKTLRTTRTSSPRARQTRSRVRSCLAVAVLTASVAAPTAAFASGSAVISDCATDGKLDKKYSAADYANALKHIPTDVDEYTNCRDVIRRGQLGLGGSSGSGGTGGGTGAAAGGPAAGTTGTPGGGAATGNGLNAYDQALATASPQERASVGQVAQKPPAAFEVGGRQVRADSLSHGDLSSLNSLPTPLVVVLVLLGLGAIAAAVSPVRTFVRTRVQRTA
ncbi:hypothetical protein NBH00_02190 [Paraconexibacter antarcticus]|uniref:Secreted protein n=1 Tax=Paraconexibacter antarcticus TaxID=2949664 RepID=A0ABY5DTW4_9ACTN|nr:hypothetical protein [Paraconexibacter antarcticus]UTI65029.1 hypothetical protein NBH00_02190 [Paraconexibacter antarcticus]